ncbi:MAG: AMP-binding protein [Rhodothermales bacterium]|nr:AMP-binding protein [Rhodothermales bacterium]
MTVPDPIRVHAGVTPDVVAVVAPDRELTYVELDTAINHCTAYIQSLSVASGQCVGFVAGPDVLKTIVTLFAILRCGAVAFPVSHRLPPSVRTDYTEAADCAAVITPDEVVVTTESPDDVTVPPGVVQLDDSARATILATSGSSGRPKLAVHMLRSHLYSAWDSYDMIPLVRGDRWLLTIPLNHVGGIAVLFRSFLAGSTVVTAGSAPLMKTIRDGTISHVSLVTTQLKRLLDENWTSVPGTLRSVLIGGSAVPDVLLARAVDRGLPVQVTYGMTEASSQIATTRVSGGDTLSDPSLMRHLAVRIRNGIIEIRGPNVFEGYLLDGVVEDPRDREGWFSTGDLGEITESGLRVIGRADRMFVSGGENIQPEEIEFHLNNISGIDRAVVVPVPDDEFGWRPYAFIEGSARADDAELSSLLEEKLPRYKIPVQFAPMPSAYLDVSKIDREELQNEAIRLHDAAK